MATDHRFRLGGTHSTLPRIQAEAGLLQRSLVVPRHPLGGISEISGVCSPGPLVIPGCGWGNTLLQGAPKLQILAGAWRSLHGALRAMTIHPEIAVACGQGSQARSVLLWPDSGCRALPCPTPQGRGLGRALLLACPPFTGRLLLTGRTRTVHLCVQQGRRKPLVTGQLPTRSQVDLFFRCTYASARQPQLSQSIRITRRSYSRRGLQVSAEGTVKRIGVLLSVFVGFFLMLPEAEG